MQQSIKFDAALLRRYDVNGPRYTSYPTAAAFTGDFGEPQYRDAALGSNQPRGERPRPLSLYVHIPFCTSPCFYCGCTRIITRDPLKARLYLERLYREIALQSELFARNRSVGQLHLGGGTPTFLDPGQIATLMGRIDRHFRLASDDTREFSIEIDPRTIDEGAIANLASLGFNRISLGVQDFDRRVQEAVNRVQTVAQTTKVIDDARSAGIRSINLDLIYGLPFQNVQGFARTLDTVVDIRPERLAVYSYAHLPQMFKAQRRIRNETMPSAETKLALLELAIEKLTGAGYVYIGMDHFALPDDELVIAQQVGHLQRNFQGYSTRADCDLVGLGLSAIGKIDNTYSQNAKDMPGYLGALDGQKLAIVRGVTLSPDDQLRRKVIQRIMCQGQLVFEQMGFDDRSQFLEYFSSSVEALETLLSDGLIEVDEKELSVTPSGRLLLRAVAMAFDAYARKSSDAEPPRYSRVI